MKQIVCCLGLLISINLFVSCSKDDPAPVNNPDPQPDTSYVIQPDTLTTGWTKVQAGFGKLVDVTDIFFTSNTSGYLSSNWGIYRSNNGGLNWIKISDRQDVINIGAWGNTNAAFVTGGQTVSYTTDGNTVLQSGFSESGVGFKDVVFTSPTNCVFSSVTKIWRSTNSGLAIDSLYRFSNSSQSSNSLAFINPNTGWIMRSDSLYKTSNGGVTWTPVFSNSGGSDVMSVEMLTENTGFFSIYSSVIKTTNGGSNLSSVLTFPYYNSYIDLDFIDEQTGFASGNNRIYKTTDGGQNWQQVVAVGSPQRIIEIHFTDANHGWACGTNGLLLRFSL